MRQSTYALPSWGLLGTLALLSACSNNYMPLGDYAVVFHLVLPTDYKHNSMSQCMICTPDLSICGRRQVEHTDYDPDMFYLDANGSEHEKYFEPTGFSTEQMEAGSFDSTGALVETGQPISFQVNDFAKLAMDVPPSFQITKPSEHEQISVGSITGLRLEWSPQNSGFSVRFRVFPADNSVEISPCDALSWGTLEGEGEDKGVVDIPSTFFPKDLPQDGCDVLAVVIKDKGFELPAGISKGFARSSVADSIMFHVIP